MYAAAPRIPLASLVLRAIYKQATPALLILGALAGAMQLLDAGIGLFQHDLQKCAGPLFLAILQFFVVYLLHIAELNACVGGRSHIAEEVKLKYVHIWKVRPRFELHSVLFSGRGSGFVRRFLTLYGAGLLTSFER
jgi:hypothetical protein